MDYIKTHASPSAKVALTAIFLFLAIFKSHMIGSGKHTTHISSTMLKAAENKATASRFTHVPVIVLSQFKLMGWHDASIVTTHAK